MVCRCLRLRDFSRVDHRAPRTQRDGALITWLRTRPNWFAPVTPMNWLCGWVSTPPASKSSDLVIYRNRHLVGYQNEARGEAFRRADRHSAMRRVSERALASSPRAPPQ